MPKKFKAKKVLKLIFDLSIQSSARKKFLTFSKHSRASLVPLFHSTQTLRNISWRDVVFIEVSSVIWLHKEQ